MFHLQVWIKLKASEYVQEIPHSHTKYQPMAPQGRDTDH